MVGVTSGLHDRGTGVRCDGVVSRRAKGAEKLLGYCRGGVYPAGPALGHHLTQA